MDIVNVTCRLPSESVTFLDQLGESLDRDRSYLIRDAVARYVEVHRWQIEQIRLAMAEVEAGDIATEEDVRHAFRREPT